MIKPDVELRVLLTQEIVDGVEAAAREYDVSTGVIVREALKKFLAINAPVAAQEQPVEVEIKSIFRSAVEAAQSWDELQETLSSSNLELIAKGGGLSLRTTDTGSEICKASDAGYGYSMLIKRFAAPFPGHPAQWLAYRILQANS